MDANERQRIEEALSAADEPTLREIVREAESFLADQLKAGLAADSRAMTFAGILAAITSFLIGGSASVIAAKLPVWPYIIPVALIIPSLLVALSQAIRAAQPTKFGYSGNDPKEWIVDIEAKKSVTQSLASSSVVLFARHSCKC
jgi:hypothetical protein